MEERHDKDIDEMVAEVGRMCWRDALASVTVLGIVLLFVACLRPVQAQATIQANSPEDFFRAGRTREARLAELQQLKGLGVSQKFAILFNIGGDGNNTTPFKAAQWEIDDDFLAMVRESVLDAEAIDITFEIALFESETAEDVPPAARVTLAGAIAEAVRDTRTVLNIAEECPLRGQEVIELIDAIHDVDPSRRVVIHNWPETEQELLMPLVGSGLYGVSGQIHHPSRAAAFVDEWGDRFAFAGIAEVGPWNVGFPPDLNNYQAQRQAIYPSLMASGFIGIYYGVQFDLGNQDPARWANAYRESNIAAGLCTIPGGQSYRPDLGAGSPCVVNATHDELRAYMASGTGTMALQTGEWIIHQHDPWTGYQGQPATLTVAAPGLVRVSEGEALVIARTPRREAAVAFLEGNQAESNGDHVFDVADLYSGGHEP